MTAAQVVFILAAAITLVSAVMVVTLRRLMQSALALDPGIDGCGGDFCHFGQWFLRHDSSCGLYWRDRHPDHLCGYADAECDECRQEPA